MLAQAMAKLPEPIDGPWPYWDHWRHELWRLAQVEPPERFTEWPPVYYTMLVRHWDMTSRYERLPARYKDVMTGLPDVLFNNCVEQAFNLWQWEQRIGVQVRDLDTIHEFGAGYGQMAWLCRRLGFKGWYAVQDLPEFRLLQEWWLGTQGIVTTSGRIPDADLFIGCYSVSEIPPRQRKKALGNAAHYLLLYSGQFDKWDNCKWFERWRATTGHKWLAWMVEDRPDWYSVC